MKAADFSIADLEGEFRVRVVVEGAANSPLELGVARLDRTAPIATGVRLSPFGGRIEASWTEQDALSGIDPQQQMAVQVNASPAGDGSGAWLAFSQQPAVDQSAFKLARTDLSGVADGPHLVRAIARDRAGNLGVHTLGTTLADNRAPVIRKLESAPFGPSGSLEALVRFEADDPAPGTGIARVAVAPPGVPDEDGWERAPADPARATSLRIGLPRPGIHTLTLRVIDRAGNRTESLPFSVRILSSSEISDGDVTPTPPARPARGRPAGPGVRVAWTAARRLHQRRARLPLRGAPRVAPTPQIWRRTLGAADAARFTGYTTESRQVLLGPVVTRGLEALQAARRRPRVAPSRADLDRMAMAAVVLLHETIHATGPSFFEDLRRTRSGRAFEEGFTEAVTIDLLPAYLAELRLPAPLAARLRAASRRYRPAYPEQVQWARRLSAEVTKRGIGTRRARAWRAMVADRWGVDRWARLASATGRPESFLRASAANDLGPRGPVPGVAAQDG